jgi:hypothetical protein
MTSRRHAFFLAMFRPLGFLAPLCVRSLLLVGFPSRLGAFAFFALPLDGLLLGGALDARNQSIEVAVEVWIRANRDALPKHQFGNAARNLVWVGNGRFVDEDRNDTDVPAQGGFNF